MQKRDENELNINEQITASQVRLVGDNIPEQGVYPIGKALQMAEDLELDLVEISGKADPPVCRILDYQKFLYQRKKKAKEMKANAAKVVIKEIRFGPNTDEHDFQFKLKHAQEFLQEGSKVKATIFFRGRSIMFKDQGEKQLLRFAVELEEFGRAENMPVLEGKRMTMMIAHQSHLKRYYKGEDVICGRTCWVFDFRGTNLFGYGGYCVWVDQETGLVLRHDAEDGGGFIVTRFDLNYTAWDIEIRPDLFE